MRAAGYVPIPMPIVPEHVLGPAFAPDRGSATEAATADLDDAWDLIRVDEGSEASGGVDRP